MFELKKVKHFGAMSRETYCYTAKLYLDGEHVADVENEGHGGCDLQRWTSDEARRRALAAVDRMTAIPKAPEEKAEAIRQRIMRLVRLGDDDYHAGMCELSDDDLIARHFDVLDISVMDHDIESICVDLMNDHLMREDLRKLMRKRVLYVTKDSETDMCMTGPARNAEERDRIAEIVSAWPSIYKVLNLLPIDDAMEIYRRTI